MPDQKQQNQQSHLSQQSQQEFRIGLLVVSGFLAIVILILVSDQISFDSYYRVTAYMENAAGLRTDSPVELAGIQIGKIDSIQTSKSGSEALGAVIAVLRINSKYTLYKSSTLTVGSSGIFGDNYLSFSTPEDDDEVTLAKDGNAVVIAAPGFIDEVSKKGERIINSIIEVLNPQTRGDIQRLIRESADTASEARQLVKTINGSSEQITQTIANLNIASTMVRRQSQKISNQTGKVLENVDQGIAEMRQHVQAIGGSLDAIAKNLETSLKSVEELTVTTNSIMLNSKDDIVATLKNLSSLSKHAQVIAEDLRNGKGVLGKLSRSEALAKDLDKIAVNIQNLSERLADHPEILIFGDSAEDRAKARMTRKQREQRRAFNEGYGSVLGTRRPGAEKLDKQAEVQDKDAEPSAVEVVE